MKNEYKIYKNYIEIFMTKNTGEIFTTQVSARHLERLLDFDVSWHLDWKPKIKNYYAQSISYLGVFDGKPKYKTLYLHRFIMLAKEDEMVDHIGVTNTLDNRDENLRIISNENNSRNRKGKNSNNTSGYRNVSFIQGYWKVQLQINGKNHLFPEKFTDVDDAGRFAKEMRDKYYGEFSGQ